MRKLEIFLIPGLLFAGCLLARAETELTTQGAVTSISANSQSFDPPPAFDLRYEAYVSGPSFRAMDGREFGPGPNLLTEHYLKPGYYFGNGWKIRINQPIYHYIARPEDMPHPWRMKDPQIGFSQTRDLYWFDWRLILYYAPPVSRLTKDEIGTDNDAGSGTAILDNRLRVLERLDPFFINIRSIAVQRLKQRPTAWGIDREFKLFHKIGFYTGPKSNVYVSYNNFPIWYRDGYKDPWRKKAALELGWSYQILPSTVITPFVETPFQLKDTKLWFSLETQIL